MASDTLLGGTPGTALTTFNANWIGAFNDNDFAMEVGGSVPNVSQVYPYSSDSTQWDPANETASNAQYAQLTYVANPGSAYFGVAVRLDANGTGYVAYYNPDSGVLQLGYVQDQPTYGRSFSALANQAYLAYANGDVLRLEVSGATPSHLSVIINGVEQFTYDDSSINELFSGQFGLFAAGTNTTVLVSNWSGGSLTVQPTLGGSAATPVTGTTAPNFQVPIS